MQGGDDGFPVGGCEQGDAVDLGELVLGAGEADLQALDLAEPALPFGLGDPVVQVVQDLFQAGPLGGVLPEE